MTIRPEFPEKLEFLFSPARYKVLHGGRGGTKSWGIARALLIMGSQRKMLVVCARETMQSIKDSVHRLLASQIERLGLQYREARNDKGELIKSGYEVLKSTIVGANGTEFIFAGLLHNVDQIKSLEGADVVWVEEAQRVSKESWDKLVPTVRAPNSEIWVSFNPELDTDETWTRFIVNPPSRAVVVKIGWRDNPWFPHDLEIERQDMKRLDPVSYRNVWDGEPRSSVIGAVFPGEIELAETEQRIAHFPVDRSKPVDTYWDLGYGDKTAIWFGQAVDGWYRLVDYLEDNGKTIDAYVVMLQQRGYLYGIDWLPHDCIDTIIHQKLSGQDKSRSIEMILRGAGRNVRVAPKLHVADRINAGRMIFSQCRFDREKCRAGLEALRRYQWGEPNKHNVTGREPLHNDASHGADAFQTFAVCARHPRNEVKPPPREPVEYSPYG